MLASHSDAPLIKRCRQEVLALAVPMIGHCLDAARKSLDEAVRSSASVAARQAAQNALDKLEQRRAAIRSSFPAALDQAIVQALDTAGQQLAGQRERDFSTLPSDTALAMIDDSELSHFVETARLVQSTLPVVERTLTRLDALMSSALGRPVVQSGFNPMRPEVLCRALGQVLNEQGEPAEVCRLWLRHLAQSYAKELDGLYGAVSDVLERADVQQAHYRVKFTDSGVGPVVAAGGAAPVFMPMAGHPLSEVPAMPGAALGVLPVDQHVPADEQMLEQDLPDEEIIRRRRAPVIKGSEPVGANTTVPSDMTPPQLAIRQFFYNPQLAQQYEVPLPPDYYAAVRQQLAQMPGASPGNAAARLREQARIHALAAADRQTWTVMPQMPLPFQQWGPQIVSSPAHERTVMELKAKATKISQALGIDAVRALVAQVVDDSRILAPVRDALAALEPALLRLALAEPHFFGEGEHPARRFIEEIAQRSFQYNNESSSGFQTFADSVQQAVQALDAVAEPSGEDFDQSLRALQADWQTRDEADQQAREQSQRSMEFAQKRQQLADKIARDLSQRPDLVGVPGAVADFLFKDWSLVIAHAQLTDTRRALDPGGYLTIVTDLLWSVKRHEILRNFARLFETVPRVIATLRRGLDMLGKDPQELQALFDMLLRFHEPALKLRRLRSALDQGATLEKMAATLQLPQEKNLIKPGELLKPQAAAQPWLGRREREATGFVDIMEGGWNDDDDLDDQVSLTGLAALEGETVLSDLSSPAPKDEAGTNEQRARFTPTQLLGAERQTKMARASAGAVFASAPAQQQVDAETAVRARAQLNQLRQGDWVDLRSRQEWRRAELTWISDNGSLYMFISHGGRAHSMTRHTLEKLLGSGHIRPLDGGAVVDKALETLIANVERELAAAGYTRKI
ncbi:MAG: DUF1631 domain-containing protein [Burkholderiaceae bacterium]|jgi:hypothetical protein|nr:DUF1631 domain-containing protein [Burkholderiaceae bacterium]